MKGGYNSLLDALRKLESWHDMALNMVEPPHIEAYRSDIAAARAAIAAAEHPEQVFQIWRTYLSVKDLKEAIKDLPDDMWIAVRAKGSNAGAKKVIPEPGANEPFVVISDE